jgi:RNA polymerase sigma-70 factor (ECF subfamily)
VVQEVFATVCRKIKTFTKDGKPAAFRRWLYTISDLKILEYWRLQPPVSVDSTGLDNARAPEDPSDTDCGEIRSVLLHRLLELVRLRFEVHTWKAFWWIVVDERSPEDVARELDMTLPAVHTAKSRILRCLREEADALGLYRAEGDTAPADEAVAVQREVKS